MISSHILDELGKLADSYGIINEGMLIDEFTNEELHRRSGNYTVISTDNDRKAFELIGGLKGIEAELEENRIRIKTELSRENNLVKYLVDNDIFIKEVKTESFSLEEYYLSVTRGGSDDNG